MATTMAGNSTLNQVESTARLQKQDSLTKEKAKEILAKDFGSNFPENVHDVVKKLYSKRNEKGEAVETITQTWRRVALAIAMARLKYAFKPYEIIQFVWSVLLKPKLF